MKKLLVMLLISAATFSQTTAVKGIVLSYDKSNRTMTLSIPKSSVKVYNKDEQVRITISKEYSLRKYIGGFPVLSSSTYFVHQGHYYCDMSLFETARPANCQVVKDNLIFKFTDVEKGEYILEVGDLCDWKWESNVNSNSLIIQ